MEVSDGIFEHDPPPLSTHRPLGPFRRAGAFLDEILREDGRAHYILSIEPLLKHTGEEKVFPSCVGRHPSADGPTDQIGWIIQQDESLPTWPGKTISSSCCDQEGEMSSLST